MKDKKVRVNIVLDREIWEQFKDIERTYYGRRLDFALNDCLKEHNKMKIKEIKKNEE